MLASTSALAIAPNGATLYAASTANHGIAAFHVAADGSLTQLPGADGCISLSGGDGVGGTSCATGRALTYPFGLTISPDGHSLYVIADNNDPADGAAIFALDHTSGAATQLPGPAGCITSDGTSTGTGVCATGGPALEGIYDPTVSPDGTSVYLPGYDGQTLSIYRRETGPTCQTVSAATPYQTSVTVALRCPDADGDPVTASIVTSPGHGTLVLNDLSPGTALYTPRGGFSGTDAFTFSASDGTNTSGAVTVTVAVAPPTPSTLPHGPAAGGQPHATPPPSLTRLRESSAAWREVRSAPRRAATTFSFTLNEAARVTLTFTREVAGLRVKGACVAPSRTRRQTPRCLRSITLGALTLQAHAGQNRIAFNGRLPRGGWLPPGRITVTAIATVMGDRSALRRLSFLIRR